MSSEPVAPSTFSALPAPPLGYVRSTPAVDASETLHFAVPKSNAAGHPLTEARHTNLPYFQAAVPAPKAKAEPRRQRQHAPEGALASVRPFQFMYYHQAPRDDSDGPPLAWSTREVHIEDPPLPRQRSAQACQKCRKRKTKVRPPFKFNRELLLIILSSVLWRSAVHAMQGTRSRMRL